MEALEMSDGSMWITLHDSELAVLLKRSQRRRTWSLTVKPGGEVTLAVPAKMPEEKIAALLSQHREWIHTRHTRLSRVPKIELSNRWCEGELFYFQGKNLQLAFERSHFPRIVLDEEKITVHSADFRATKIKRIVEDSLEEKTFHQAQVLMQKWSPRFNLPTPPPLKLRVLKRSWGQCRSDGRITLHKFLSRLHPDFFEYVLVHEFCHLFHMNHGPKFKGLLTDMLPHWKELKKMHEPQGALV
jgi:predicted metal-dependent hydrolase